MKTTHHRQTNGLRLLLTLLCCIAGVLPFLPTAGRAQEQIMINQFTRTNGSVFIRFTDGRTGPLTNFYGLHVANSLSSPMSWTNDSGAVFSVMGTNQYLVTAPATASFSFYRIVDFGPIDTDGDGVPDAVEIALGTNPNVPDWITDSDGDGFCDGLEIVNGSSPTNATSRILRSLQPGVQFVATTSKTLERAGTIQIPVEFNTNYSGQLHYSVSIMSTATNGMDFSAPVSGTVTVNSTNAAIPIDIKDDSEVENIEAIVLELNDDAAGTYHVGAFPTHTVLLMDNDANWSGLLQSGVGESSFRLCVLHSNAQTTAMLIPSSKSSTNHLGGQLIPLPPPGQDGWLVTNLTLTPTNFIGDSVALPAGASRLLGQVPLARTFHFSAVPPPPGDTNTFYLSKTNATFGPLFIAGEYAEVLAPAQGGIGSQQFTNRGYVFLAREVPVMTPLTIPTTPVQP